MSALGPVTVPTLETERLILRAPEVADFDRYAAFYADTRSRYMGGPMDRPLAWRAFAMELGHWFLRGYGFWTITERASGAALGRTGFYNPEGWLETELGWALYPEAEGKGFAREAALAARNYAYTSLGWPALISVIAPENTRSIALARRLGAQYERDWTTPRDKPAQIWRHPGPDAREGRP